ncbi:MAG: DUF1552 domain-containing protein [Myxococcota bacterium]
MKINRRAWLRGAGGFTLALPFLPSLLPRAEAASGPLPRFVGIMSINGQFTANWNPDMSGETQVAPEVFVKPVSAIRGPISPVVGSQFDSVRSKLSVLRGLDGLTPSGHNRCFPLTASSHSEGGMNRSSAPFFPYSLDAVLEHSEAFYPEVPLMGAMRLSPFFRPRSRSRSVSPMSFSWWTEGGATTRLPFQWDAETVFNSVFAGGDTPPDAVDPRERRRLVIDRVKEDFDRLQQSRRLATDDKQRLENYVDHLRDIQTRLSAAAVISCEGPAIGAYTRDMDDVYRDHIDILVAALACGVTRVGCFAIRHCQSNGEEGGYHGNSHQSGPEAEAKSLRFNTWVADRVAELLTRMDSFTEADGSTLLDNSAVIWSNEIAKGSQHNQFDIPVLMAGSACGRLRTGVVIDYHSRPDEQWARGVRLGRPYNQLLTTIMQALGLSPSDWELAGRPGFGDYQLMPHRYARGAWDKYAGTERDPLPHYFLG